MTKDLRAPQSLQKRYATKPEHLKHFDVIINQVGMRPPATIRSLCILQFLPASTSSLKNIGQPSKGEKGQCPLATMEEPVPYLNFHATVVCCGAKWTQPEHIIYIQAQ